MRLIILVTMLFASKVSAQPYTSKQDQYNRFKTSIINGGFENGTSQWSASGGSFTVSTTSGQFRSGVRGGAFDASAASQTLTSAANTVSPGNNQLSCYFKTTATDYTFQAFDGTNVITSQVIPASTEFQKLVLNVATGTPSALRARISSGSNAAAIYVDDCFAGEADNIGSVSQASLYGSALHPSTLNCAWQSTSTSFGAYSADSDCPTPTLAGNALAPSTKIPAIRFPSLPPGDYLVIAKASFRDVTLDSNGCAFAISDGTSRYGQTQVYAGANMGGLISTIATRIKYDVAQSEKTFSVEVRSDNAGNTCSIGLGDTASEQTLEFMVYRFPLTSEQAWNPNLQSAFAAATHSGSLTTSTTSGTYSTLNAAAFNSTRTLLGAAQAPSTANNFGMKVANIPAGSYMVVASGAFHTIASSTEVCQVKVSDGTNSIGTSFITAASSGRDSNSTFIGFINYPSAQTNLDYVVQWRSNNGVNCWFGNFSDDRASLALIPLSQSINAPLLVGNVVSNSSVTERIERATVLCSSSSSVTRQSGSWISSIGNISSGVCSLTLASGLFSANPTCVMTIDAANGGATVGAQVQVSSTTSISLTGSYNIGGTTTTNTAFNGHLICMGPRP